MFAFVVNFFKSFFSKSVCPVGQIEIKGVEFASYSTSVEKWRVWGAGEVEGVVEKFKVSDYNSWDNPGLSFYSAELYYSAPKVLYFLIGKCCIAAAKKEISRQLKQFKKEEDERKKARWQDRKKG